VCATIGPVIPDVENLEPDFNVKANMGNVGFVTFGLAYPFMGFADFRAAFDDNTSNEWTIEPEEGALRKNEETEFVLRFRPERGKRVKGTLLSRRKISRRSGRLRARLANCSGVRLRDSKLLYGLTVILFAIFLSFIQSTSLPSSVSISSSSPIS
jgi:hypothetical protein